MFSTIPKKWSPSFSLNVNCLHRVQCFNTLSLAGGTVWQSCETFSRWSFGEEVCHWRWPLRLYNLVLFLLTLCFWLESMWPPNAAPVSSPSKCPCSPLNYKLKQTPSVLSCFLSVIWPQWWEIYLMQSPNQASSTYRQAEDVTNPAPNLPQKPGSKYH